MRGNSRKERQLIQRLYQFGHLYSPLKVALPFLKSIYKKLYNFIDSKKGYIIHEFYYNKLISSPLKYIYTQTGIL